MPVRNDFSPGEFCWLDLTAHDMKAAVEWYGPLFGWQAMEMPTSGDRPPYAFLMKGEDCVGGIGQMHEDMMAQGIPPVWNSYVATADCAATEAKARELGATITVPTMDVEGHGKLCFMLDPEGGAVAVWESTAESSPGVLVQEPGSLSWNELMTRDSATAQRFYGELFGWKFAPMPMDGVEYMIAKSGDTDAGGFMPMDGPKFDGVPAHWLIYFHVDDVKATSEMAAATGGAVHVPPTSIPIGEFSCLADPQGGGFAVVHVSNPGAC